MSYSKVANTSYSRVENRAAWLPGLFQHVPLKGFAALFGSLIAYIAAVAVLVISNGQPTARWTVQPAVYLTIAYTLNNILIRIALKEGADVLWWTRAMSRKTTISDLHHTWETGNSAFAALKKPTFGLMALASLAVSLTAVNGPFLQRATRTRLGSSISTTSITIPIATALPSQWYTAFVGGRNHVVSILTSNFTTIVQNFTLGVDIEVESTGCIGTCTAVLPGVGFGVNCTEGIGNAFNLTDVLFPNGTINTAMTTIFSTDVTYSLTDSMPPGYIWVEYKNTTDCIGATQVRTCTLKAATVQFPITVVHNKTGSGMDAIALTKGTTIFDDAMVKMLHTHDDAYNAQVGGIYFALSNAYTSLAQISWQGAINFQLITSGSVVNRYANVSQPSNCTTSFSDPTVEILGAAREMMFRTAIAAADLSMGTRVIAQQTATQQIYHSDYIWLGVATALTAVGFLLTLPTFKGYWKLGREVSMSPVELAKAFAAPMLAGADSNADVDTILKTLGDKDIRYGACSGIDRSDGVSLTMENPRLVRRPEHGELFGI